MCHCADFHSVAIRAYDGNPVNLNSLPPQESAKRYLDFIGGGDKTVAAAQIAFDKGRL
jgi:alkyl sulfatase BDS1-like metallo-beta-lactamase superfamily hydrolase